MQDVKVNGIDKMNMEFDACLDHYRNGMISKGEYFNTLVVLIQNEAAKYQGYLEREATMNEREQKLLASFLPE